MNEQDPKEVVKKTFPFHPRKPGERSPRPKLVNANFPTLIKVAGITKGELTKRLGVNPKTVTAWSIAAPQYAMAYLELMVDYNAAKLEVARARTLVMGYLAQKANIKEMNKVLDQFEPIVEQGRAILKRE